MSRRGKNSDVGTFLFIFIVGGALYLIMNMPIVFFLVVLPLAIMLIGAFIRWLKK